MEVYKPFCLYIYKKELFDSASTAKLHKLMARVAGGLTGNKLNWIAARIWRQEELEPVALNRKLVPRIERMLAGPLAGHRIL